MGKIRSDAPVTHVSWKLNFFLSYGIRTPDEAFFQRYPKLLALGRQIGLINSGAFGVFSVELSAFFLEFF